MQKKIAAFALTGAVVLGGGAAIAIPAMADSTTPPSPSSSPTNPETSRADAIKNALKGLVDDKTLTQAQADKVAGALSQPGALGPVGDGHRGPGGLGFGEMQAGLDAAAKVLGMSADDVRTALRGGSTLADLAKKQGKDETTLVNALVDAAKTQLADAVKAGRLTQARSDEIAKDLPTRIKDYVDNGGPRMGMRGGPGFGRGVGPDGGPGASGNGGPGATPGATPSPGVTGSATSWTGAEATSTV